MTYTAQQFEIKFYEAMAKWAAGGKVGPDPRGEWEYQQSATGRWFDVTNIPGMPAWDMYAYRWKPAKKRTVFIDGVELVATEVDVPAKHSSIFLENGRGEISQYVWNDDSWAYGALKNGKIFLTREDAQAMADAQRKQRIVGAL